MLSVKNLSIAYGQHQAVSGLNISVNPGEVVVILGANGAGKSSLLRAVSGLSEGNVEGDISFSGETLRDKTSDEIVNAGIALVPEGRAIFGDLSVEENLKLGAFNERAREHEQKNLKTVLSLFPKLRERRRQVARTMSGGEQQMVAIGRALMSDPTILMLDEPSLGLSPLLSQELFQALGHIRETGIGVLVVEQNAKLSLSIADRGYLIENGRIVGENDAASLASDPSVQKAYLGAGAASAPSSPSTTAPEPTSKRTAAPAVSSPLPPPLSLSRTPSSQPTPPVRQTSQKQISQPAFISPQDKDTQTVSASQLIGEDMDSLLNRASRTATDRPPLSTSVSARHTSESSEDIRPSSVSLPSSNDPKITEMLADFEASAKNARTSRPPKTPEPAAHSGPQLRQHQGPLPAIPVFKKARVEIYKRNDRGQLVKSKEA